MWFSFSTECCCGWFLRLVLIFLGSCLVFLLVLFVWFCVLGSSNCVCFLVWFWFFGVLFFFLGCGYLLRVFLRSAWCIVW